jgi:SAM-dependent methyltransferase
VDLFADALQRFHETGRGTLHIERDDGYRDNEDLAWYLTTYRDFPSFEKQALRLARGRVLDVGCGAGRHALYLQRRGLRVTCIDSSPRLVELCQARGVKDARVANACGRLPFRDGEFDTILLFGNNLGLCGTLPKFRGMLRELNRVTSPRGRVLGTSRMPSTTAPVHLAYLSQNVARGRPVGQIRLRLEFDGRCGPWFSLLLFSPMDLLQLAAKEGWRLTRVMTEDLEEGYAAMLEK